MKNLKIHCIVILLIPVPGLFSQNQCSKWYFGNQAGLDFMTNPPTVLTNGAMNTAEGCASIADAAGNLLFYTDGATIWNQLHVPMANGSGLLGNGFTWTSQAALIEKQPGNNSNYYLFTLAAAGGTNGLRYSVVDMSLAAGMGSVTVKNVLLNAPCTEQLAAVRHCNGTDVWIMSHDWNSADFRVFLLSSTGVNAPGIVSTVSPLYYNNPNGYLFFGYMKFSPNGKKLGLISNRQIPNWSTTFTLFDFDNTTGALSNSLTLFSATMAGAYGCEFSADGSKFYGSRFYYIGANPNPNGILYQWDLCQVSNTAIISSQYTMAATNNYGLQLAPDGKIYVAREGQSILGVINDPNKAGSACNYVDLGQSLGIKTCSLGLPGFAGTYLKMNPPFTYTQNAQGACQTATFSQTAGCNMISPTLNAVSWSFGDPASGAANTSTLSNPVHTYPGPGTYTVQMLLYNNCVTDTVRQTVIINSYAPILTISGNPAICNGMNDTLSVTGATYYNWSSGATGSVTIVNPGVSTAYTVTGASSVNGCSTTATFDVNVLQSPTLSITGKTVVCFGTNITFSVTGANTYSWNSNPTGSPLVVSPALGANIYTVTGSLSNGCSGMQTLVVQSYNCNSIDELQSGAGLKVYPNPNSGFFIVDSEVALAIQFYNESGAIVLEKKLTSGKNVVDIRKFENGIYLVKPAGHGTSKIIKIVKTD